jgi:phosphoglycerate dehydrogenase-like enzyme
LTSLVHEPLHVGVMTSGSGAPMTAALTEAAGIIVTRVERPEDLPRFIDSFDALLVSNDFYHPSVAALVGRAPRLRYLHFVSSGFDNLREHGAPARLAVSRGGQSHAGTVAEHAVTLLLALVRRVPEYERNRVTPFWDRQGFRERMGSLEGATVLIIGFGAIGQSAARRLRPFETRIIGMQRHNPTPEVAALADAIVHPEALLATLAEADALLLAVPLSAETEGLIGSRELRAMKPTAYVINVARGGVVDEAALIDALATKRIAGAGLDVFANEPLAPDSPLWNFENVILSPHVAGSGSTAGTERVVALARENLERFRSGAPLLNPVAGFNERAT